jgi:hypothetical protein
LDTGVPQGIVQVIQDELEVSHEIRLPFGVGSLSQDVVGDVKPLKTETQSVQIFAPGYVDGSLEERFVVERARI